MWQRIRTFGELQILTRASYFMLLFVPILAGVWPAVRVFFNRYNQAVTESKAALEAAAERLEFAAFNAAGADQVEAIQQAVGSLQTNINAIVADYALKAIENVWLPSVWVVAFLAALAVTLGHLLYQALAPVLIQKADLKSFVTSELQRFAEYRSEGQLDAAIAVLEPFIETGKGTRLMLQADKALAGC